MKRALLIIDVQNDYFPGGKFELCNATGALGNIEKILLHFRTERLPVIHVQHINTRQGAAFFVPDTEGVRIHQNLSPLEGEHLVVKGAPNSFFGTNLRELIRDQGVTDLAICGMMSHMCVDTTVRACKDYGIGVTLLDDACATRDLTWDDKTIPAQTVQAVFMASINGTFAAVLKTDDFLLSATQ